MALAESGQNILREDLDFILQHASASFEKLRGKRIFITGGTGFFGIWLLESFAWANRRLELGAEATVLSRDPGSFTTKAPHIANDASIKFTRGDVRDFAFPDGDFTYVIHAATESTSQLNYSDPSALLQAMSEGTKRVLALAKHANCRNLLLTSSGLVYGPQPSDLSLIPEAYRGSPDPLLPGAAYGEGKRMAELLTAIAARDQQMNAAIARGFAFVGPHLPIDAHFAIGNFIRDGIKGGPLTIQGDGTPRRSYLYTSDLMIWLWTMLTEVKGVAAYNVGSEKSVSIKEVAETVRAAFSELFPQASNSLKIEIAKVGDPSIPPSLYVPSVQKISRELGLVERVSLLDAVKKTILWNKTNVL